jgi:hypothetical protein
VTRLPVDGFFFFSKKKEKKKKKKKYYEAPRLPQSFERQTEA